MIIFQTLSFSYSLFPTSTVLILSQTYVTMPIPTWPNFKSSAGGKIRPGHARSMRHVFPDRHATHPFLPKPTKKSFETFWRHSSKVVLRYLCKCGIPHDRFSTSIPPPFALRANSYRTSRVGILLIQLSVSNLFPPFVTFCGFAPGPGVYMVGMLVRVFANPATASSSGVS